MSFINPNAKYVDLAALSMSGSLVPSVPTQLMIKFNPPKMTIVYHFTDRGNQQFFHDIMLDEQMLATQSTEDVVSHLYVTEAYYFNPKQVKRSQLLRLISMIQQKKIEPSGQGQINIQDNAFQNDNTQIDKAREARRKNFFEKKRFINYPYSNPDGEPDTSDAGSHGQPPVTADNFQPNDRRGATNANALNSRKRFDDLQIRNNNILPSHSPQPDMPTIASMTKLQQQPGHLANLPPLKGQRQGPISDPIFLPNNKGQKNNLTSLSSQPEQTDLHRNSGMDDFVDQQHQQAVAHHLQPQYNQQNNDQWNQPSNNVANDVGFESGADDVQQQVEGGTLYDNEGNNNINFHDEGVQGDNQYQEGIEQMDGDEEGADGEEDEGESVYMIDGVVMRMIQIEGEENQYLMDPQGRIYDMQANFIGTANTQGLEEMGADGNKEEVSLQEEEAV